MFENINLKHGLDYSKLSMYVCMMYVYIYIYRSNLLTQHPTFQNEIRLKIGGDHGGGSFKMNYQVCNTEKPNSKENSVVFSIFEAKDYRCNLKVGLSRFRAQVDDLQSMEWG